MTKNEIIRRWYTAKDIRQLLGISSGQLFHWGQTWGLVIPEIEAPGRAFKDKYSFRNLLELALIKELNQFGFEPSQIKRILKHFDTELAPKEWRGSIWNFVRDGREDDASYEEESKKTTIFPGFDKAGCLILIYQDEGEYLAYPGDNKEVLDYIKRELEAKEGNLGKSFLIIDLLKILNELENKTGERL